MTTQKDNSMGSSENTTKRKMHPNSLKNIENHKFKPGQSGNPNGTARGTVNITNLFHKLLAKETDSKTKKTLAEALATKMIAQALKGGFSQQNLIVNRTDGNVPWRIAGAGGDDLFSGTQESIEKIFTNPKAMELAIKLSNCLNETKNKPDGKNNGHGNTATNE